MCIGVVALLAGVTAELLLGLSPLHAARDMRAEFLYITTTTRITAAMAPMATLPITHAAMYPPFLLPVSCGGDNQLACTISSDVVKDWS